MKNPLVWIIIFVLAALAAWYFTMREDQAELERAEVTPAPAEAAEPEPERYPVEQITVPPAQSVEAPVDDSPPPTPPEPLPTLAESDPEVREKATELAGDAPLDELLVEDFLINRFVSTLDALDTRRVAPPMRPLAPVPGRFRVLESDEMAVISPENAERYAPYVALVEAADTEEAVALYVRYYPLLQEAYRVTSEGDTYFNDRVVDMIDLLLATPEPTGLIEVVRNEAVWEFADPELESLAVGQKYLLRLSKEDRRRVKDKLRALRDALAGAGAALDEGP